MEESFLGDERKQRKLENECRKDMKIEEKKIALDRKILDLQLKEISANQRLPKSRYMNLVIQSNKSKLTDREGKRQANA